MDALRWHEPVYPGDTLRVEFERHVYTDTEVMTVRSYNVVGKRPS